MGHRADHSLRALTAAFFAVAVAACTDVSQQRPAAAQFDSAVKSLAAAQEALYQQDADLDVSTAAAIARTQEACGPIPQLVDLRAAREAAAARTVPPAERALRTKLLDGLALYAARLDALAQDHASDIDANAGALGSSLTTLDSAAGLGAADPAIAAASGALGLVVDFIVGRRQYDAIKSAATDLQPKIVDIVTVLKRENSQIATHNRTNLTQLNSARIALLSCVASPGPSPTAADRPAKGAVLVDDRAMLILGGLRNASKAAIFDQMWAETGSDPGTVTATAANDALDALVTANDSIAKAGPKNAWAAIQVLAQRVEKAVAVYNSVKKGG